MFGTRDLDLLDRWQRNFPLVKKPFAVIGGAVGLDEGATIETFRHLIDAGAVARIGAVVRPHTLGASTLAAMRVPAGRLDDVADIVSREPLVNHNYARTHEFNLWFVVAGPDPAAVAATLDRIERRTGLSVLNLPLERAYHLDLGFSLARVADARQPAPRRDDSVRADARDRALLAVLEDGLPLTVRPYREVAARSGLGEQDVLDRLRRLVRSGIVTRFGCVVRHRALGYTANAMAVWDIADEAVDEVAAGFARHPRVTLCYRRPRRPPAWPYNLFCMVHAKSRPDAESVIESLDRDAGTGASRRAVLFSTRCFKQRGARYAPQTGELQ
jgi:DNA-binding Lrp family transcriptional regulator